MLFLFFKHTTSFYGILCWKIGRLAETWTRNGRLEVFYDILFHHKSVAISSLATGMRISKPRHLPLIWSVAPFEGCNGRCPKVVEMSGAAPESLKSLSRADSSHACRHSLLADDDLNPFVSSRTAWTRHPWIGAYSDFHLFDGWRHAIPRLSELSLCLTTYPNSGFFRWHRSQTRLRVRTLRSQLLLVDFIEKPFDRLLHASTVSTPSRI